MAAESAPRSASPIEATSGHPQPEKSDGAVAVIEDIVQGVSGGAGSRGASGLVAIDASSGKIVDPDGLGRVLERSADAGQIHWGHRTRPDRQAGMGNHRRHSGLLLCRRPLLGTIVWLSEERANALERSHGTGL